MHKTIMVMALVILGIFGVGCKMGMGNTNDINSLVSHIDTSTVALMMENTENHSFRVYCTGVWVSEREILTAHHCVQAAANIAAGGDGNEEVDVDVMGAKIYFIQKDEVMGYKMDPSALHWSKVIADDGEHDLALVEMMGGSVLDHEVAVLAKVVPENGGKIHIVGHVKGLFWTYIEGVVAGYRVSLYPVDKSGPFLQLSAPVFFGNSGGGVFNDDGELVGIVSFMMSAPLTNFAIPVVSIRNFIREAHKK